MELSHSDSPHNSRALATMASTLKPQSVPPIQDKPKKTPPKGRNKSSPSSKMVSKDTQKKIQRSLSTTDAEGKAKESNPIEARVSKWDSSRSSRALGQKITYLPMNRCWFIKPDLIPESLCCILAASTDQVVYDLLRNHRTEIEGLNALSVCVDGTPAFVLEVLKDLNVQPPSQDLNDQRLNNKDNTTDKQEESNTSYLVIICEQPQLSNKRIWFRNLLNCCQVKNHRRLSDYFKLECRRLDIQSTLTQNFIEVLNSRLQSQPQVASKLSPFLKFWSDDATNILMALKMAKAWSEAIPTLSKPGIQEGDTVQSVHELEHPNMLKLINNYQRMVEYSNIVLMPIRKIKNILREQFKTGDRFVKDNKDFFKNLKNQLSKMHKSTDDTENDLSRTLYVHDDKVVNENFLLGSFTISRNNEVHFIVTLIGSAIQCQRACQATHLFFDTSVFFGSLLLPIVLLVYADVDGKPEAFYATPAIFVFEPQGKEKEKHRLKSTDYCQILANIKELFPALRTATSDFEPAILSALRKAGLLRWGCYFHYTQALNRRHQLGPNLKNVKKTTVKALYLLPFAFEAPDQVRKCARKLKSAVQNNAEAVFISDVVDHFFKLDDFYFNRKIITSDHPSEVFKYTNNAAERVFKTLKSRVKHIYKGNMSSAEFIARALRSFLSRPSYTWARAGWRAETQEFKKSKVEYFHRHGPTVFLRAVEMIKLKKRPAINTGFINSDNPDESPLSEDDPERLVAAEPIAEDANDLDTRFFEAQTVEQEIATLKEAVYSYDHNRLIAFPLVKRSLSAQNAPIVSNLPTKRKREMITRAISELSNDELISFRPIRKLTAAHKANILRLTLDEVYKAHLQPLESELDYQKRKLEECQKELDNQRKLVAELMDQVRRPNDGNLP